MRNIILIILIVLFYYLVKSFFSPPKVRQKKGEGVIDIDDEMVKDPCCGVYIPKKEAIEKKIKGQKYYFCSKECMEKFKEGN